MTEAKLAPNLPGWMVDHANRYLSSGGTDGHMYKMTQPGRPEIDGAVTAADDDGPEVRREVRVPAVLRRDRATAISSSRRRAARRSTRAGTATSSPIRSVEVQVGTTKVKAHARTATGEERARLWEKSLEFWPPYADYQHKTEREIPVVVLDPVK